MKRSSRLIAHLLTILLCTNIVLPATDDSAKSLEIISPVQWQHFSSPLVEVKVKLGRLHWGKIRATLNGKDVTVNFGPPNKGVVRAVFGAHHLTHGLNTIQIQSGPLQKATQSFYVENPLGLSPAPAVPCQNEQKWIPIQTRIINGDGTHATDYAIKVGDKTYSAPPLSDGSATGFQMLLLDRCNPSRMVENVSISNTIPGVTSELFMKIYNRPSCGEFGCLAVIQSLQTIGTTPRCDIGNCTSNTYDLYYTPGFILASMGGTDLINNADGSTPNTGYSLISNVGPQGAIEGAGYERLTCNQASNCGDARLNRIATAGGNGEIIGALILDNTNAYTFAYPGRATFSIRTVAPTGGNTMSNTTTIGNTPNGASYQSAPIPDSWGAFQVVVVYRDSLQLVNQNAQNTFNFDQLDAMTSVLEDVANHRNYLVLVSSIGANLWHNNRLAEWAKVGKAIEKLGGTFEAFARLQQGDTYSFVGSQGASYGNGMAEASSVIARETRPVGADPIPAQLRGLLAQDNRGFYSPTIANTTSNFADSTDATIDAIALQAPTPWPEMDTPGKLAAYAYISQQLLDLPGCDGPIPCDVRATYDDILTKGTFDPSKVTFPTDQTNFKNFDFSAVQRQLSKEAKYSQYVLNLYGALDSFYSNQQATINAILTSAYQKVSNSLHPPSDASSTPNWELVFSIGLDIVNDASGIAGGPPLQAAVDAFSIATTLAAKFSNTTTGDPRKNLSVTFANLLDRSLADASEHSKVLDNTFNLILTDWGRLETLGQQIQTTEITWTGDIETAAKTSFTIAASQHYYTQLTKSVYQIAWFEDLREGSQPAPRDWCDWTVQQADCPVSRSLAIGSWAALATGPSGGSGDGLKYDFLILTRNTSPCDSTSNWAPGSVTNNIVAPLTPGDTTTMGLWKPYFYRYGGFDLKFNPGYGCSGFNNRCEWCEF